MEPHEQELKNAQISESVSLALEMAKLFQLYSYHIIGHEQFYSYTATAVEEFTTKMTKAIHDYEQTTDNRGGQDSSGKSPEHQDKVGTGAQLRTVSSGNPIQNEVQ